MTDEQKRPEQNNNAPDFGEIQIGKGTSPSSEAPRLRPRSRTSAARPLRRKAVVSSPDARPVEARRKKAAKPGKGSFPAPCLLAVPVLLFLLHLAFSLYLFPMLAKGPLAARISQQLGRPVAIGQASLSPFGLDLRLSDIVAGPVQSRKDDQELAKIEEVKARIQLDGLLHGKIVLRDVTIDRPRANLIRHADGSFNAIPPGRGSGIFGRLNPLPSWLRFHGLRLTRGTVHFLDQGSGRKDLIEHVEFHLPAAGQGMDPTLSAVVNSSPVQIIGQRHAEGSSNSETRLALKLDNVDPQQYLALAPALAEAVTVRADSASAMLEIVLQDKPQSGKGPSISGSLVFSSLVVQSAGHENAPEQQKKFELAAPKAELIIRASPLQNLYTLEELVLEEPRLIMGQGGAGEDLDGERLAVQAAALLNPKQLGIAVGRLSVSKGIVRSGRREWTDLQIELTGFRSSMAAAATQEKAPAAALSLSAVGGEASFVFKGSADSSFNLSGSLELKNMSADLLRPYLSAQDDLRFAKGTTDLSGELRLDQLDGRAMLKVSGSSIAVRDFVLQQKKTVLLSGRTMNGQGCTLDGHDRRIVCSSLALEQANFASVPFFLPGDGRKGGREGGVLRLLSGSLELKDSSAILPMGSSGLALSGIRLNLTGLMQQQLGQFSLAAAAGSQGTLEINGSVGKSKGNSLSLNGRLVAKNVAASLLESWLPATEELRIAKGAADLVGELRLDLTSSGAALKIEGSSLAVRDFALQRSGTNLLVGKTLSGAACLLDRVGSRFACDRLTLEQADFADPAFFLQPSGQLGISCNALELKNASGSLPLGSGQGWPKLPLSGLRMSLTGLQGPQPSQLSLAAAAGSQGTLEVSGSVSGGKGAPLGLTGQIALKNMDADLLRPWLSPQGEIRFVGGMADLAGVLRLGQSSGAVVNIDDGSFAVRNFDLQRSGIALLAGKAMRGTGCALDSASRRVACERLALDQTHFAANAASFFLKPDGMLHFSANALEVADSSGLLPLGAGEDRLHLPLSGLNLSLTGLREQQPESGRSNLSLEASVDSRGKIKAHGTLGRDGRGSANLTASELDVRLFGRAVAGLFRNDFALALEQGSLSLDGRIDIPGGRFAGSFSVDQMAAENKQGDGLSWQRAAAENAAIVLAPFSATIGKLSLQDPSIRLASADGSLPLAFFAPFLQQEGNSVLMRLAAEECSISGGSLRRGSGGTFSDVRGTIAPLKAGAPAAFALNGKMGEGDFAIKGRTSRTGASIDLLSVDRLPLDGVVKGLAEELHADGTRAKVSRTVSGTDNKLNASGFVPRPDSEFALPLALLADKDGSFGLSLHSMPLAASDDSIVQAVADHLRQLGRQPEKALPALAALPKNIEFMSGDKVPDFMDGIKGFPELLAARPHLGVAVRGCFDEEEDRKTILEQLQKMEEKKVEDENRRRRAELEQLMDAELKRQQALRQAGRPLDQDHLPELRSRADLQLLPARPAELPERALENLAGQRAGVIRDHFVGPLRIPARQVRVEDEGPCGTRVELALRPVW